MESKQNVYKGIFVYSLIFFLIRFFASKYGMTYDEAEQFIDAQSYVLGYSDQPPLYSWILKSVSYIFGLNTTMMTLVYHSVLMGFLIYLFKITELVFKSEKKALWCFLSYTLFFIYSYDFYRYTIHTALMMLLCAASLYTFFKIYFKGQSWANYFYLALFFALGILSKYNFIFFIAALIFASLFDTRTRAMLINIKTVFAVVICLLILSPHLIWIMDNDFSPIHYALKRGDAGALTQEFSLLPVVLNTYWNYIVYAAVIAIIFFKDLQKEKPALRNFLLALLAFSILMPLSLIFFLKAGNFSQRWLAPLNIFIPIIFFSFVQIDIQRWQHKAFKILIFTLFLVFYAMRIGSYYFPDQTKLSFLNRPYQAIYLNLKNDLYKHGLNEDMQLLSFKEVNIVGGVKSFHKDIDIKVIYPNKYNGELNNRIVLFSKDNKKSFERFIKKNHSKYDLLFSKSAPYLHSKKQVYKLNFARIKDLVEE